MAVTEPTVSGVHDLKRAVELMQSLGLPLVVCINKADLNPDMASHIREVCAARGPRVAGQVSYDTAVVQAQLEGMSIAEYGRSPVAEQIREIWNVVGNILLNPEVQR